MVFKFFTLTFSLLLAIFITVLKSASFGNDCHYVWFSGAPGTREGALTPVELQVPGHTHPRQVQLWLAWIRVISFVWCPEEPHKHLSSRISMSTCPVKIREVKSEFLTCLFICHYISTELSS